MEFHDKCTLKCSEIYIRKTRKFTCNMQKKNHNCYQQWVLEIVNQFCQCLSKKCFLSKFSAQLKDLVNVWIRLLFFKPWKALHALILWKLLKDAFHQKEQEKRTHDSEKNGFRIEWGQEFLLPEHLCVCTNLNICRIVANWARHCYERLLRDLEEYKHFLQVTVRVLKTYILSERIRKNYMKNILHDSTNIFN